VDRLAQNPRPQTVAIAAEDAEFSRNAAEGARKNVQELGFKIVYDKAYPPNATDFSPIIRAIQATSPELVVICSYPNTSVGMVQSASELGLKPKMMGGGMVESATTSTIFFADVGLRSAQPPITGS
jgi:branched-chain amino acid transport system substrate-binding protein